MIRVFPANTAFTIAFVLTAATAHAQAPTRLTPSAAPAGVQRTAPQATAGETPQLTPERVETLAQPSGVSSIVTAPKSDF